MTKLLSYSLLLLLVTLTAFNVWAENKDCPSEIISLTSKEIETPVEVLALQLRPLTKCELYVEADAWFIHLKAKIVDISTAEIALIYEKDQISATKDVNNAIEDIGSSDIQENIKRGEEVREALTKIKDAEQKSADVIFQTAVKDAIQEVKMKKKI